MTSEDERGSEHTTGEQQQQPLGGPSGALPAWTRHYAQDVESARAVIEGTYRLERHMTALGEGMVNRGRWLEATGKLAELRALLAQFIGERLTVDLLVHHAEAAEDREMAAAELELGQRGPTPQEAESARQHRDLGEYIRAHPRLARQRW